MKTYLCGFWMVCLLGCNHPLGKYTVLGKVSEKEGTSDKQFSLVPSTESELDFRNDVEETKALNFLNFTNIYNGGGVVAADFDNDNLVDIFFVANQNANKLYRNKGNFQFEDVTQRAGVADPEGWSTGASAVDVNND
ncbi:MAG: VCBS repeat-containing protein, partial [Bacteroidota bacterium]